MKSCRESTGSPVTSPNASRYTLSMLKVLETTGAESSQSDETKNLGLRLSLLTSWQRRHGQPPPLVSLRYQPGAKKDYDEAIEAGNPLTLESMSRSLYGPIGEPSLSALRRTARGRSRLRSNKKTRSMTLCIRRSQSTKSCCHVHQREPEVMMYDAISQSPSVRFSASRVCMNLGVLHALKVFS